MTYSDKQLDDLMAAVSARMSEKRFSHTLGVAACAVRLGRALLPEKISELKAAALLHDVSKELPVSRHLEILRSDSEEYTDEDFETKGVLHSFTAPYIIKEYFPDFYIPEIVSAVYNHTVGSEHMSVFDKIIFISDYIEQGRTYASCIKVRDALMDGFDELSYQEKLKRLDEACIGAIDGSAAALISSGQKINSRMYKTRESLIRDKLQS